MEPPRNARLRLLTTLLSTLTALVLAACTTGDEAPPSGYALTPDPHGKGWRHPASGFVFPKTVAGFERQTIESGKTDAEIAVNYRLTSDLRDENAKGFVNERMAIIPAKGASLEAAFASAAPVNGRYFLSGCTRVKTGRLAASEGIGSQPGLFAEYRKPAAGAYGYNEDGLVQIAMFPHGDHLVVCTSSFAQNREEYSRRMVANFFHAFPWP